MSIPVELGIEAETIVDLIPLIALPEPQYGVVASLHFPDLDGLASPELRA